MSRVLTVDEGYICEACALMIANGETHHDIDDRELEAIAEGTAGWSLNTSEEHPELEHSIETCETCRDHLHGNRFYACKLVPLLPSAAYGVDAIVYLREGHTPLCAECASKEGLTSHDGHSAEGSNGLTCDECEAVIVEDQNTHECEDCGAWVNPDECLTVGSEGYTHECTACKATLKGVAQ